MTRTFRPPTADEWSRLCDELVAAADSTAVGDTYVVFQHQNPDIALTDEQMEEVRDIFQQKPARG